MSMEQTKNGNAAVIAVIAVVVVATLGVFGWMFAKKAQAPAMQPVVVNSGPIKETQSVASTTKSADTMAGWQTYVNATYGYSLNFPASWKGYTMTDAKDGTTSFLMPTSVKDWKGGKGIVFDVTPVKTADLQKLRTDCAVSTAATLGETAQTFIAKSGGIENIDLCYAKSGIIGESGAYSFFYRRMDKLTDYPSDFTKALFDESEGIAKSFKSVQSSADATAGWQTYTNKDFGFELKIPQTWKVSDVKADLQENNLDLGMKMLTLSAKDAKGAYHDIETIVITPTKSVAKCGQTVMCNMGEKIAEKGGYVFGGVFAALGGEPGSTDFAMKDLDGVLASFK